MQSLPFRLLVVNELDLKDAVRSDQHNWQPPGVVEESACQPLWKSKPNLAYPQELGLILLSAEPATIKSLRLRVELARAPAQIDIFAASPPRQEAISVLNPLDAVSRYLRVDWKQCGEPLVWKVCTSEMSRDHDSRIAHLDVSECSFIKLVVHAPLESPRNPSQQVVLEDIELLGSTEDSSPIQRKHTFKDDNDQTNHRSGVIHRPVVLPLADDYDELQAVLLDAGVPMDLVALVADISRREPEMLLPSQQKDEVIPESRSPSSKPSDGTLITEEQGNEERDPASPFDTALRQYIEQTARERSMLEEILATKISKRIDDVSSWQCPAISPTDPANSNEITLYTFGTFFTQCLLCGGADIQVTCVQMAERTAPLLKNVIGPTCAFEGIVAMIILGIREAKTSQVFQTAIHLAYTIFLAESTCLKKPSDLVEDERCSVLQSGNSSALRLIEEVACANWSYGLRVILEWTLASPFCWSISHTGKPSLEGLERVSKAPPSVDRGFLQFIRLLVDQDLTRTTFFGELLDFTPTDNATGLTFARNHLRLLRLILRSDIIRCHVSPTVKVNIRTLCVSLLSSKVRQQSDEMALKRDGKDMVIRLASECLAELDRLTSNGHQSNNPVNQLTALRSHLEASNDASSHHSHHYSHTALFTQDTLLEAEKLVFTAQLQRYFSSQPRPNGLYRHSFVRASQLDDGAYEPSESFQKGNIAFQGQVVARTPPTITFHDEIQRNTAPFVFNIGDSVRHPPHPAGHHEIVSSFAAFKGTIERRNDPLKRSNKVSPEQQKQDLSITKSTTTSKQPVPTAAISTKNTITSDYPGGTVAKDSSSVPEIVALNQTPATSKEVPAVSTQQLATTPPVNSPAPVINKLKPKEPTKQLISINQTDRRKRGAKGTSQEKVKSDSGSRNDGKDPDHCILQ
ncbi:hypothetical protein PC128_g3659 [Phytophthora cactorum]|nr:hypothetical protein PC128_g3659 [Phytophthora cactorum]